MYLIWCSIFVLRIPINNLYVAFVSAIGRRSFTVGFFFFGINTVFEVYQDAGMLFSFRIILFIEPVKILIQCVSFPRIFNKSGFIPSGPADFLSFIFFICCVTSVVVICGSSMYPIYLTFATIS